MRALLILVLIVVLMAMGGWLVFTFQGNSASVEVQTEKIKQDTSQAVQSTKEMLNRVEDSIDKAIDGQQVPPSEQPK
jgi:hypothetical protein